MPDHPRSDTESLTAFPSGAAVDPRIESDRATLVFPASAAWLTVPLAGPPGCYCLSLRFHEAAAVRLELETSAGWIALPLTQQDEEMRAVFALDAPLRAVRLMPQGSARLRVTAFSLTEVPLWRGLLPDWQVGPLRLPHTQRSAAQDSPAPMPGAGPAIAITARDGVQVEGLALEVATGGALELAFTPPLPAGRHRFEADFSDDDGAIVWVAPSLFAAGAAPNAHPVGRFRRLAGTRYRAEVVLRGPVARLVFQPRQECGRVSVSGFSVRPVFPPRRGLSLLCAAVRAARTHLGLAVDRWLGADPGRDTLPAAILRLCGEADRRHRARQRLHHAPMLERWLARPVTGPAHGDLPPTDPPLRPGDIVSAALAPILARTAGAPPFPVDTERSVLGLGSAPRFAVMDADALALPLVRTARRPAEASPLDNSPAANPSVSVITATRDAPQHIIRYLETIAATDYPSLEIVLVDNGTTDPAALAALRDASARGITVLRDDRPFNFAALSNLGAAASTGEVLVFANNDLEFSDPRWLLELTGALQKPAVGVAGARLHYPDGRVQHAGITFAGEARVRHAERFAPGRDGGHWGRRAKLTETAAVTGALMGLSRALFETLGGFRAERYPVLYNDVDLCLRARWHGLRSVLVGTAFAVHHESTSIGPRQTDDPFARGGPVWRMERALEADRFRRDWAAWLDNDPCYPAACDPLEAEFRSIV